MTQADEPTGRDSGGRSGRRFWSGFGGDALTLAYLAWLPLAMLVVGVVVASLPFYIASLSLPRVAYTLAPADPGGKLTAIGMRELHTWGVPLNAYIAYLIGGNLLLLGSFLGMGALILWRTWRNTKDWMALCAAYLLITFPLNAMPSMLLSLPSGWAVPVNLLIFLGDICTVLFGYLFPTGQFVPRWTSWLALGFIMVWGLQVFVPGSFSQSLEAILFVLILVLTGCLVGVQIYRYRKVGSQIQRQQSKWVFFGLGSLAGGSMLWDSLSVFCYFQDLFAHVLVQGLFNVSQIALQLIIPLCLGFAILRYRLWDIDIIIRRTLVYTLLTVSIVGLYILVVSFLGELFHAQGNLLISLLATGLVAVLFQPLRELLQRAANRLLYGQRDEPYRVISQLGQRLEATFTPDAVLSAIVETVAQALKLPYAAISLHHHQVSAIAASYGKEEQESLLRLPLLYQSQQVGELLLAPRARGEIFTPADRRLLVDLTRQIGMAAHAVQLTTDLQRSRERLVTAREEERRRLRRDLHDGLGPTLGALTLKAGSARALFSHDPLAADRLMGELENDIEMTVVDIRRLVYALRPPALDELGLVGALRECAAQSMRPSSLREIASQARRLVITVEAPESLPELPAAVEVAAYRIVQEALTNVARHARAQTGVVRLWLADGLYLEVSDDGSGLPVERRAGVGLASMQERAMELGGTCLIETPPTGGTRVFACLPTATDWEEKHSKEN